MCSSLYVQYAHTNAHVFQILQKDGSSWFSLEVSAMFRKQYQSEIDQKSELLELWFKDPLTDKRMALGFPDSGIPIVPHSWYHVCLGLDTVSGMLRIVVNGVEVVNEEKAEFRNISNWRPESLDGKILVFKEYFTSFWAQKRGKFTNMNVFAFMITLEDMMMRTSGEADCTGAGDYLSWEEMEWSITGDVESGTVDTEDICHRY